MTRDCKRPDTIDREGGDCADPTCRAHDVNEDGPYAVPPRMPCGCPGGARTHVCGWRPAYGENPDGSTSAAVQCQDRACTYPNPHTHPDLAIRNPDHDTACRCSGCLDDPYVDPAG